MFQMLKIQKVEKLFVNLCHAVLELFDRSFLWKYLCVFLAPFSSSSTTYNALNHLMDTFVIPPTFLSLHSNISNFCTLVFAGYDFELSRFFFKQKRQLISVLEEKSILGLLYYYKNINKCLVILIYIYINNKIILITNLIRSSSASLSTSSIFFSLVFGSSSLDDEEDDLTNFLKIVLKYFLKIIF